MTKKMSFTQEQNIILLEKIKSQPILWKRGLRRNPVLVENSWKLLALDVGVTRKI